MKTQNSKIRKRYCESLCAKQEADNIEQTITQAYDYIVLQEKAFKVEQKIADTKALNVRIGFYYTISMIFYPLARALTQMQSHFQYWLLAALHLN